MSEPLELEAVKSAIEPLGFRLIHAEADAVDSGSATFSNGHRTVTVNKDHSQWMFSGSRRDLEPLGLWKAFDQTNEFCDALVQYLQRTSA